ncbi:hypothetical protein TNCV_2168461 [Trichonephila clavipes]|nr:hypothetical protein TNCV_2168461 [Trichonephila clavipes]
MDFLNRIKAKSSWGKKTVIFLKRKIKLFRAADQKLKTKTEICKDLDSVRLCIRISYYMLSKAKMQIPISKQIASVLAKSNVKTNGLKSLSRLRIPVAVSPRSPKTNNLQEIKTKKKGEKSDFEVRRKHVFTMNSNVENEINNAAPVPISSEMRNVMKYVQLFRRTFYAKFYVKLRMSVYGP